MKTFIKKARLAIEAGADEATVTEAIRMAYKVIDKTAERGIIHKNQAARRKARLMHHFHKVRQQAQQNA